MTKFNLNEEVKVINPFNETIKNKTGFIKQIFNHSNEYLVSFPSIGMSIFHESEITFNFK